MGDEPRNENDIVRGRRQRLEKEIISWHTAKVSLSLFSFSLVQLYTKAIILHSTLTMTTRDVSERLTPTDLDFGERQNQSPRGGSGFLMIN